ncbi:DNA polymerase subunit gamma-1-like isoform X1 [Dreissena polymorpha]|uniref:DNA polymerase subunit gamma-1-like isoform X1 n=2 Tax=Dreissena polymorpha TaxID=45954 RepID=UPI0022650D23|nr:DNA polymerase subunit gamma-1-like isoform X1 [Dreissena polymorpha]
MKMSWCKLYALRKFSTALPSKQQSLARLNEINIQLLPETLHKQIFKEVGKVSEVKQDNTTGSNSSPLEQEVKVVRSLDSDQLKLVQSHLKKHNLWDKNVPLKPNIELQLPEFEGDDIGKHFRSIASQQVDSYKALAQRLCGCEIPRKPAEWALMPGWVRYGADGIPEPVEYPPDDVLVFDVEVVVEEGNYPTMATAVSDKYWYSWCSDYLVADKFRWASKGIELDDLIPLETRLGSTSGISSTPRLVMGHNVAFDRSFVREQYLLKKSRMRFLDTMSLHIAICGLTNFQRVLYKAAKTDSLTKPILDYKLKQKQWGSLTSDDWKMISSMNNLSDVHQLHVGGERLDKDPRNIFLEGTMQDVRDNFQNLMLYCANDVVATYEVFKALWPEFCERFPHPVTLAGMFEMSTGYLPVNQNWQRYVNQSNTVYEDMQNQLKQLLMRLANDACKLLATEQYKADPWLWDLDWTVKPFRLKKQKPLTKKQQAALEQKQQTGSNEEEVSCIVEVLAQQDRHSKVGNRYVGYPEWFKELCANPADADWRPGPSGVSPQTRVTPKLLRLTWDGYLLHFDDNHGWGYLVPGRHDNLLTSEELEMMAEGKELPIERLFPYQQMCELMNFTFTENPGEELSENKTDKIEQKTDVDEIESDVETQDSDPVWAYDDVSDSQTEEHLMGAMKHALDTKPRDKYQKLQDLKEPPKKRRVPKTDCPYHTGDGPYDSVNIPGCWFFKIPHKDGKGKRVGNPLAKDYLNYLEDKTLSAQSGPGADTVLKLAKACSYWKNNQKRIEGQMAVWLKDKELPLEIRRSDKYIEGSDLGAIIPRIIPAGTITRRGVEPTWMTASNAYTDRIGSELKAMVQSPPGYCFVGADVDSQELWIGAVLGDAHFAKTHGCTALGWMTLQGNKKDGTDLHSMVAKTVNISRDHAKVFNYGRIYGAGQTFAEKLLLQFNHRMTSEEAKQKAQIMFSTTKGRRSFKGKTWVGGSESAMFNRLEEIANRTEPRTPVLGCRISKALEPDNVLDEFMTSRINWVVQSSAVDYLHLMLVCMNWLCEKYDINARFSISIHDEVRYLVLEEDRYRAALALQITNLLTRAMFAHRLGIKDLPLSVAFFSAVDIDQCLRKEVSMDCVTPSNPHGLLKGYQIPIGEALDIHEILKKTDGLLTKTVSGSGEDAHLLTTSC